MIALSRVAAITENLGGIALHGYSSRSLESDNLHLKLAAGQACQSGQVAYFFRLRGMMMNAEGASLVVFAGSYCSHAMTLCQYP
jgi:hypothetical protein